MNTNELSVENHYGIGNIMQQILAALDCQGKNTAGLVVDDLAPVDEFHSRGRASTTELAALSTIAPSDRVLDVGCGLGGSARHLADKYGCNVTGLDLTPEYIDAAEQLTKLVGMQEYVVFQHGSALQLPFAESTFDVVWTEHAQMNIADKDQFYSEIVRVLRPGGRLMFHDIFAGDGVPDYPLPWAEMACISRLATEANAWDSMKRAGLEINDWITKVDESVEAFRAVLNQIATDGLPPLGIHLLMGATAHQKITNYVRGMESGHLSVSLGVATKP